MPRTTHLGTTRTSHSSMPVSDSTSISTPMESPAP
jgi:hypothetical protein